MFTQWHTNDPPSDSSGQGMRGSEPSRETPTHSLLGIDGVSKTRWWPRPAAVPRGVFPIGDGEVTSAGTRRLSATPAISLESKKRT